MQKRAVKGILRNTLLGCGLAALVSLPVQADINLNESFDYLSFGRARITECQYITFEAKHYARVNKTLAEKGKPGIKVKFTTEDTYLIKCVNEALAEQRLCYRFEKIDKNRSLYKLTCPMG